jgi:hypothetical protein
MLNHAQTLLANISADGLDPNYCPLMLNGNLASAQAVVIGKAVTNDRKVQTVNQLIKLILASGYGSYLTDLDSRQTKFDFDVKPIETCTSIVSRIIKSKSSFESLYTGEHPYPIFKNVWDHHVSTVHRASGLLLTLIYALDKNWINHGGIREGSLIEYTSGFAPALSLPVSIISLEFVSPDNEIHIDTAPMLEIRVRFSNNQIKEYSLSTGDLFPRLGLRVFSTNKNILEITELGEITPFELGSVNIIAIDDTGKVRLSSEFQVVAADKFGLLDEAFLDEDVLG